MPAHGTCHPGQRQDAGGEEDWVQGRFRITGAPHQGKVQWGRHVSSAPGLLQASMTELADVVSANLTLVTAWRCLSLAELSALVQQFPQQRAVTRR